MKRIVFAVVLLLASIAAPALCQPATQPESMGAGDVFNSMLDALHTGRWQPVAVAVVLVLVFVTRRYGPTLAHLIVVHGGNLAQWCRFCRLDLFLAWTATDRGGAWMALAWSAVVVVLNGLIAGRTDIWQLMFTGAKTAFTAMGLYSGGKRILPGYRKDG